MDRKKYIVEASDDVKKVMAIGVTHGGAIWTDTTDIENLEELNSDYINEHFGDLQDEAYKRGFEDGKAQREHDEKIEVGDEVIYNGTTKCIVVRPEDDERYASLIDRDGTHYSADHRECKKTGRHFDNIPKILAEMRT